MSSDLLSDPMAPPAPGTAQNTGNANGASGGYCQSPLLQGFQGASELMQQQQPPAVATAVPSTSAVAGMDTSPQSCHYWYFKIGSLYSKHSYCNYIRAEGYPKPSNRKGQKWQTQERVEGMCS